VVTDDLEMGAIAKHCEIEEAAFKAFSAGEDMLLICATPETIRRGYKALLEAAREKRFTERRLQASLRRIAATKALAQPPTPLSMEKFNQLAQEIKDLNKRLEYAYPGESHAQ
jgi:beta-glucosidase-like glycosyl hydrolase